MKDLSLHLLDVARNSFEAGASQVKIHLIESLKENFISFTIEDDGKGMDEVTLARVIDPFYTTRTTRKVGLGLSLLKANANLAGGDFSIDSTLGRGTLVSASFAHDHIDRPPLGDLAESFITLLLDPGQTALLFTYQYEEKTFSISTMELEEILGEDVPLTTPAVLSWVRGYIQESIEELKK